MIHNPIAKLLEYWRRLSPEWRFAIGGFAIMRLGLTVWSLAVYALIPVAVQNLDLFGAPVLTVFDLQSSERYTYSRCMSGEVLVFRSFDRSHVIDEQTGSLWDFREGKAVQGPRTGQSLNRSSYSPERVFPYVGMAPARSFLLSAWQRFDANWYLKIATRGYDSSDGSTVYFPLYPLLIRALAYFVEPVLAALLISNLALVASLALFYRLVSGLAAPDVIRRSLLYFLVFPTAFFLAAPYTESLFLFLSLGSFYCAARQRWSLAVLLGALSALTRLQGFLLLVPLAYLLWRQSRGQSLKELILRGLPLLVIPLATISFLALTNLSLIDTYQGIMVSRFVLPLENIFATISLLTSGKGSLVDALNLAAALGWILMLYFVWKKLPFEYFAYSLLMLLAPLLRMTTTQPLVSMTRYVLAVFPVFVLLGMWGENRWVNRAIIYLSVLLQLYASGQFILWGWFA